MRRRGHASDPLVNRPERAQFFTPRAIAEFMWQAVRLLAGRCRYRNWRLIDPAASRGAFLEVALAPGRLSSRQVYGIELDAELVGRSGEGARPPRLYVGDGLLQTFPGVGPGSFDVVLGNPPFGRLGRVLPPDLLEKWQEDRWQERFAILRAVTTWVRRRPASASSLGVELLFVERCLDLAREGGVVALVLPEGFVANDRLQAVRDWVLERAAVLGVVALPGAAFRRAGLNARTVAVFLRKGSGPGRRRPAVFMADAEEPGVPLEGCLETTLAQWRGRRRRGHHRDQGGFCVPAPLLRGKRWDAGFWIGRARSLKVDQRSPQAPLGDFIELLTYGAIVTGQRPCPAEGGIRVIRQGDFTETGLFLDRALRVAPGCVYDPNRSRVRQGDLLMPRSGWGSLGRNRVAVYLQEEPANVGCFVDLVRLDRLNPFFAWFFLRSSPGWRQIRTLINGVGVPNISFAEIRSLQVPLVPGEAQQALEQRYLHEVWPLHRRRHENPALRQEGGERFGRIAADLESFLAGQIRTPWPAGRVVGP